MDHHSPRNCSSFLPGAAETVRLDFVAKSSKVSMDYELPRAGDADAIAEQGPKCEGPSDVHCESCQGGCACGYDSSTVRLLLLLEGKYGGSESEGTLRGKLSS